MFFPCWVFNIPKGPLDFETNLAPDEHKPQVHLSIYDQQDWFATYWANQNLIVKVVAYINCSWAR